MPKLSPVVFAAAIAVLYAPQACATAQAEDSARTPYGSYLAARQAATNHDMVDAGKLYRATLADDPNNIDLLNRAFLYTAAAGDVDAAEPLALRIIKTDPQNRSARMALAVAAIRHGDFAAARMHIAGSGRGPFQALTLTLLDAWAAQGAGDIATALKDTDNIAAQGGTAALAALHKALVLDLADRKDEAENAYKSAIALSHDDPRAVDAFGRFLVRAGRSDEAKAYYQKYLADPGLEPIAKAALTGLDKGRKTERMVSNARDGAAESLFGIASMLATDNTADFAILYLRYALYLRPDFDLAKIILADRFEALKRYEDAIAVYQSIKQDSPYGAAAAVQAASDYSRIDQPEKAVQELKDMARRRPDDLDVWTALGDAYRATEDWANAANAYDKAIGALGTPSAKDWPLYYARGVARERTGNWTAAESDLQTALKLSPDQASVLNYLGYTWVDHGVNLGQALSMLERARTLSPFDGYIVDSVGWAYYKLGRYKDAARTLEDAVLLVPGDPTINDHLGDAYWKVGRKLDAHFQWSHALAFGPDDKDKPAIEKKLQDSLSVAEAPGG